MLPCTSIFANHDSQHNSEILISLENRVPNLDNISNSPLKEKDLIVIGQFIYAACTSLSQSADLGN
jgi:hypothetical protein